MNAQIPRKDLPATPIRSTRQPWLRLSLFGAVLAGARLLPGQTPDADLPAPAGVVGEWDMATAWSQESPTRAAICLNGLWRFHPIVEAEEMDLPPASSGWGWFKVPGIWPYSEYFAVDPPAQDALLPAATEARMKAQNRWFDRLEQAWYRRDFVVPERWQGRRVLLDFTLIQSRVKVVIDGREAGEILFPGGRLDITELIRPGRKQTVAVLLTARPLREEEKTIFMGPNVVIQGSGRPNLVGITGDVFLVSEPKADAIADVQVITSTRRMRITFDAALANLTAPEFTLAATVSFGGKVVQQFRSGVLHPADIKRGRVAFDASWTDPRLWDTDTPQNLYDAAISLLDAKGQPLDETLPVRFGFREFWIDGRDLYLNGSRIHLRARMLKNNITMADKACLAGCRTACGYLKEYGYNFFLTTNYGFGPGDVGYMDALYTAADESGLLCSFSVPHAAAFGWLETADQQARYKRLTEWLIRRVQNHPSIVLYAANHNATGYTGDQDPLKMDGIYQPPDNRRRQQSLVGAGLVHDLDPTRPVYNHHSGNLGDFYTINIYLNWSPRQERSEWLEYWSTHGTKPMFFVEWGPPHAASWSSFRGPGFIWSVPAFQQIWDSEFASEYVGQPAFRMTPLKIKSLEKEEAFWATGKPFAYWLMRNYLVQQEENHTQVQSYFMDDNLRALRTWGISGIYPFDEESLWLRTADTSPQPFDGKYQHLQEPGIVPDRLMSSRQFVYDASPGNFVVSSLGRTFKRWNMPVACYIGGGPSRFVEKSHIFLPGESIQKQLVLLNDARRSLRIRYSVALTRAQPPARNPGPEASAWSTQGEVQVEPGQTGFVPITVPLPASAKPGGYLLTARFDPDQAESQSDSLAISILPTPEKAPPAPPRVALFDPKGNTAGLLRRLGVSFTPVDARSPLAGYDELVIGREALTLDNDLPSLDRVPQGMNVLVFEQSEEALTQRLGFRVQTRGIRNAFVRVPGHPALAGLAEADFADWRGAATLVPPHFDLPRDEITYPTVRWCGFENTRVWRNGNDGNIASVIIEKPSRGDWLPLLDCGFDLQYSPLLEYREGRGRMVFCQLDVTQRTLAEPAAERLCRNLLNSLATTAPAIERTAYYAGAKEGARFLTQLGVNPVAYSGQALDARSVLIVTPGCGAIAGLAEGLRKGAELLALGLDQREIESLGLSAGAMTVAPTTGSLISDFGTPDFQGISNAELHTRTLKLPVPQFVETTKTSNELLKYQAIGAGGAVFCQIAPWMFDYQAHPYLRTTYRRSVFLVSRLLNNLGIHSPTSLRALWSARTSANFHAVQEGWRGIADKEGIGRDQGWWKPEHDAKDWKPVQVPGAFDLQFPELRAYTGQYWYRARFTVPDHYRQDSPSLYIGRVSNESWVWLNGEFVGEMSKKTNPQFSSEVPGVYRLDPSQLKPSGDNVLVVLVNRASQRSPGGIMGRPGIMVAGRWLHSYYLQEPVAEDDPYRYFRW